MRLLTLGLVLVLQPLMQAQIINLADPNTFLGNINDAIYSVDTSTPSGTDAFARGAGGVFLTIQNNGFEQGYNTSAPGVMDTKRVPQFNYEILASQLTIVDILGRDYVPFLLDINEQANNGSLLSLDDVRIFSSSASGLSYQTLSQLLVAPELTQLYALDNSMSDPSSYVLLDFDRVSSGSGKVDMGLFVPLDHFAGVTPNQVIYLYSAFGGDVSNAAAGAGFEEWTLGAGRAFAIPEPAGSLLITLSGLVSLLRRRRF